MLTPISTYDILKENIGTLHITYEKGDKTMQEFNQEVQSTQSTQPLLEAVRQALADMMSDVLDNEKAKRGRRFSTYHEAHAFLSDEFQDLAEDIRTYGSGLDKLWGMVKEDVPVEHDVDMLEQMVNVCLRIAEQSVRVGALTGKLMGGVVHPPRKGE